MKITVHPKSSFFRISQVKLMLQEPVLKHTYYIKQEQSLN